MFKTFIISPKVYNILNLSAKVLKNKGITKMQKCNEKNQKQQQCTKAEAAFYCFND